MTRAPLSPSTGRMDRTLERLASMGVGVSLTWAHVLLLCPPAAAKREAKGETGGDCSWSPTLVVRTATTPFLGVGGGPQGVVETRMIKW